MNERTMINILDAVHRSGCEWLYDAVYAVLVLAAAVTFPLWAVPYAICRRMR